MTRTDIMKDCNVNYEVAKAKLMKKGYIGIDINGYQIWRKSNFLVELIVNNGNVRRFRVNAEQCKEAYECFLKDVNGRGREIVIR